MSEEQKRAYLAKRLARHAEIIGPVRGVADERRWNYREKTCLRAGWRDGRWNFGFLARVPGGKLRDYELIGIPDCPVHSERVRRVVNVFSATLPGPEVLPLGFLVITGALATLVLKGRLLPDPAFLDERRLPEKLKMAGLGGLYFNLNPGAGQRVFSVRGWKHVWGDSFARDEEGSYYGPSSFQQLIPELRNDALGRAREFLRPGPHTSVIDIGCGIGTSLRLWSQAGAGWIGVELNGEAVECARRNTGVSSGILRGRASERIPQLQEWIEEQGPGGGQTVVFANPPRSGLETEVLKWLAVRCRPSRIAYLSCNPVTLDNDLKRLEESGYQVRAIQPYDFFPQTRHVEALALLEL